MSKTGAPPVVKDIDHAVSQPVAVFGDFVFDFPL
jgi:hypothetical protein